MGATSKRIIATALAVLLIGVPGAAMGQRDHGAELVVTLKNGETVKGELLAVKPDRLLILKRAPEEGTTVDVAEISTVRIVRKSRTILGGVAGLVAGAGFGAIWFPSAGRGDDTGANTLIGMVLFGAPATALGLVIGTAMGFDPVMVFEGRSEDDVQRSLAKLNGKAREWNSFSLSLSREPEPRAKAAEVPIAGISPPPESPLRRHRTPRFRLTWAPGLNMKSRSSPFPPDDISFRFLDATPPADSDSRSASIFLYSERPRVLMGRMSLAYEWDPRWSAELELFFSGWYRISRFITLESRSATDGRTYRAYGHTQEEMDPVSLLLGLTFRPFPPAAGQPHVLEFGAAGGLAWPRASPKTYPFADQQARITESPKAGWTARVRVSYDHYFVPAFGIGAFAEYRWLEARTPSYIWTEILELQGEDGNFARLTELAISGRRLALDDFAMGLRFVIRL